MMPLLGVSFNRATKQSLISDAITMGYTGLFGDCGISEKKIGQALYAMSRPEGREFTSRTSLFFSTVLSLPELQMWPSGKDRAYVAGHYYSRPPPEEQPLMQHNCYDHIRAKVKASCLASIANLNADQYLDLYLMPLHSDVERMKQVWAAMEELVDQGLVRSIGVSGGFTGQSRLETILTSRLIPSVNQVDISSLKNKALLSFSRSKGILTVATLSKTTPPNEVQEVSARLKRSPEEVWTRWAIENDCSVILQDPDERTLRQCIKVFDWQLAPKDIERLDSIAAAGKGNAGSPVLMPSYQMSLGEKFDHFGASGINFR